MIRHRFEIEALVAPGERKLMSILWAASPADALERALLVHGSLERPVILCGNHAYRANAEGVWINESGNPWEG